MRIEAGEHEVRLRPETDFERVQLERLRQHGIESVKWTDDWDRKGDLVIELKRHPWDERR
jgi:hypothetical protein